MEVTSLGQFDAVFNILIVVTIISIASRRFRIPSAASLILAGIISTLFSKSPLPELAPAMFTSILLPPIIFQETLHTDIQCLVDDSDCIATYAIAGTVLMLIMVTSFVYFGLGFNLMESLLLGIIIAPTDPVAVLYAFKEIGVVKRFERIVSGESLFNDGVAIVLFSIVVSIISLGTMTFFDVVRISLLTIIGGVVIGLLSGYAAHILLCWVDDKYASVLISFIIAFGVFRVSEGLGASGVISTVTAGLVINYRTRHRGEPDKESIEVLETLWEFVGFTASSIAFIFIGTNLDLSILLSYIQPIILLYLSIIFSRYIMVQGMAGFLKLTCGKQIPGNWKLGLFWSGLRGAVSIVLVLSIQGLALVKSEFIVALTFGVVLISNLIHGPSIPIVIQKLNILGSEEEISF
jgi:CPA1 family monovalent cation:H+ antiporter